MTISSNPRERMSIDSFTYPLYRSLREQGRRKPTFSPSPNSMASTRGPAASRSLPEG